MFYHNYDAISFEINDKTLPTVCSLNKECKIGLFL